MKILGIDVGSSSVKAGVLSGGEPAGKLVRAGFETNYSGVRVEVDAEEVVRAIRSAIRDLGPGVKKVEAIGLTVMAPSWVAMDAKGRALTPIVTHQDRRSVGVAKDLEKEVGKGRHLKLAGNRPFPGGISSTTCAWYLRNEPGRMKRCDLVGHLNTFLHRRMTGARVTDPSNASFMGMYLTVKQGGWSDVLVGAVGAKKGWLPEVKEADRIGGRITREAAREFGLVEGTPMMVGCMDTSAALLLTTLRPGQVMNVSGSTDVLALVTDRPVPHERLLTRALGVGNRWTSVSTMAAAGSSLVWAKEHLFADLDWAGFWKVVGKLAPAKTESSVVFEPYLAGERTSIEQKRGAFTGLTLSTTREEMLKAVIESLAKVSAERIPLLQQGGTKMRRDVFVSGGTQKELAAVLHRDWPGKWTFRAENEATLRGLGRMTPRE